MGIGDKLIAQLTRRHVNEFRDRLLLNGRSEHLTRRAISVLKLILDHAIDNGQLFTNAAHGVRIIKSSRIAGHSSIQMTMERYGHLFPSPDHQKAMAMVEAKLLG